MATLGKTKAIELIARLTDIRRCATLKGANFSDELKETVALHHSTWLVHPLDDVIFNLERIYDPQVCDHMGCDERPILRRTYRYGIGFKNLCIECCGKDWAKQNMKTEVQLCK